ncbi:MAG: phosphonate metabolism transcriptional regulator PhnF [Alphaproteobacteria bacterium]|nr:phosphonate metabolism transcriptional regulator PhnF [Alphaproteobacteria bacterium]
MGPMERQSGVALWRQIADQIRIAIGTGEFDDLSALPGEVALAKRFSVNRHTVRSAIASLKKEGVLRVEQGRGTFIVQRTRLRYPVGRRTRFTDGLADQASTREGLLKSHAMENANSAIAEALELPVGAAVIRLDSIGTADAVPVSRGTRWLDAERFPGFVNIYRKLGSVTASMKVFGIEDYVRIRTRISAHHADPETLEDLRLSPGAIVLVTEAVNAELNGRRLEYSNTSFAADRVEIDVDHSIGQQGEKEQSQDHVAGDARKGPAG